MEITGNVDCRSDGLNNNRKIDSSGYEIHCERDPSSIVLISANVVSGGRNLGTIELPAYESDRFNSLPNGVEIITTDEDTTTGWAF